jgi:hypothetical protein
VQGEFLGKSRERSLPAPFPYPLLPGALAIAALAATALDALAFHALATGAGFFLDVFSFHDRSPGYGGVPWSEG